MRKEVAVQIKKRVDTIGEQVALKLIKGEYRMETFVDKVSCEEGHSEQIKLHVSTVEGNVELEMNVKELPKFRI